MERVTIDRLLAFVYVAVFVIINLIVNHCGPWVIPITTVAAVCVNMMIRDFLLYDSGLKWSATTCAIAGAITVLINYDAGMVAIASFVAVVSGAFISGGVYRILPGDFDSKRWPANIASAIGDALIFPTLSFMAFMPEISAMQFISKMASVTVITIIMRRYFTFEGRK
ncbi:hypothetical protein [Escherichia coli]|uniref:hypothetical protein n=1 Tax=Escherichia coli TaxID=562 RepID=UPI001BFC64DB|nr:hypothetical protein [Escherichia coli]